MLHSIAGLMCLMTNLMTVPSPEKSLDSQIPAEEASVKPRDRLLASSRALYDEGEKKVGAGELAAALTIFEKIAKLEPKNAWAQIYAADVALQSQRCELAIKYCNNAIQLDASNPKAWHFRGHANALLERYSDAEKDFTKEIETNPRDPTIYCSRAEARRRMEKYDDAIRDILKARRRIFGPDIHLTHTVFLLESLHFDEALEQADQLVRLYPSFATGRLFRGAILIALGRDKDAEKEFAKAIEMKPEMRPMVETYKSEAIRFRTLAQQQTKLAPAPRPKP